MCVCLSLSVELDQETAERNERRQLTGCDNLQIKVVLLSFDFITEMEMQCHAADTRLSDGDRFGLS